MRVVHLSYYYGNNTTGAPVAARRLHLALLRIGVDSHFICISAKENGPSVHQLPPTRCLNTLFYLVTRGLWVFSKIIFGRMIMANILPVLGFSSLIRRLKPDLIHIHLLSLDMLSFKQIERLKLPCIYTLHDLTAVIATDTHPWSDNRFITGYTKSNSTTVERWMFKRKKTFIDTINPLFTGPSQWVCNLFSQSLIGRGRKCTQIPNVNDPAFRYDPSKCNPHKDFVIIFGSSSGRHSVFKGWEDLMSAVSLLPEIVRDSSIIHVFGEEHSDCVESGIRVHFLGKINSPEELNMAYHSSDIYALPSRMDNAPQVKFEAFACGLPVISFDRAGCPEYIISGENGWIAKDNDIKGYMQGILFFYEKFKSGEMSKIREAVANRYSTKLSEDRILDQYCEEYKKCLMGNK